MDSTQKQLEDQRDRWNSRAEKWDENIKDEEHYANFEEGYKKFLILEEDLLQKHGPFEVGLDIGCGSGVTSVVLQKHTKALYILDLAENMLKVAKEKVPNAIALHSSATDIPLDNNSVDVVISRGVIPSHLPRNTYIDFFKEAGRVIRKGGLFIFDFISNIESVGFSNLSPKITYTQEEIEMHLTMYGFKKISFDGESSDRVRRVYAVRK